MTNVKHAVRSWADYVILVPTLHQYHWRHMPVGSKKVAASPIDAVMEVLKKELRCTPTELIQAIGTSEGSISRCRQGKMTINHDWLLRASLVSGIPYKLLCDVAGIEIAFFPHQKAWKTTNTPTEIWK